MPQGKYNPKLPTYFTRCSCPTPVHNPDCPELSGFTVLDSGERAMFDSGMVRDTASNKIMYDLVFDGPMLERYAAHLTKGASKYSPRNWMKAEGTEELERFRSSAARHFMQWMRGDTDEDHASAIWFNVNGYEYTKAKMEAK